MSVSNQTNKTYGSGNGVTTTFSYPFKIFDVSELYAYLIDASGNVTGPLTYTTDFSATISSVTEGGTITFVVAPPSGYTWFLKRIVPYTQSASIPSEGTFPGKQFENQLDLQMMAVIQANETVTRCLQLPATYLGTLPVTLPGGLPNAAIGWDPTGSFLTNVLVTAVGPVSVPISNTNLQQLVTAGLVSGAALTLLPNTPSGAGLLPVANIPTGVTANKLLLLNGSAKIPAVDGSLLTNVVASINANLSGNQFGAWVSRTVSTIYQAATDGLVVYAGTSLAGSSHAQIVSDSSSSPSTIRAIYDTGLNSTTEVSLSAPVRKGDYYQATGGAGTLFFLPMGS